MDIHICKSHRSIACCYYVCATFAAVWTTHIFFHYRFDLIGQKLRTLSLCLRNRRVNRTKNSDWQLKQKAPAANVITQSTVGVVLAEPDVLP